MRYCPGKSRSPGPPARIQMQRLPPVPAEAVKTALKALVSSKAVTMSVGLSGASYALSSETTAAAAADGQDAAGDAAAAATCCCHRALAIRPP